MSIKAAELGIRAAVGLGTLAYNYLKPSHNSTVPGVMPMSRAPMVARRVAGVRRSYRRRYSPKVIRRNLIKEYVPMRRTSASATNSLTAGVLSAYLDITLNQVYTTDIISTFDVYRIRKVVVEITPQVDLGNNGVVNNSTLHFTCANDTNGDVTSVVSAQYASSFGNYKYGSALSGGKYLYTFYPKVSNTIDVNGTASGLGNYATNPWIKLDPNGIQVPHHRLLTYIASTNTASTQKVDFTYTIYFDVKRLH